MNLRFLLALLLLPVFLFGCSDTEDLIDQIEQEINEPGRKSIDRSRMGVNNFFVDPEFGSIAEQFLEIRDTLGLKFVRVLFAWTTDVQPTPGSDPFYGFFDDIVDAIPPGMDVMIVLAHTPSWMTDSANWIGGSPRTTWVERWLRPTVARYAGRSGIVGYQVFNEPDDIIVASDSVLGLTDPLNYCELLTLGSEAIRTADPSQLVVLAATRSIQQNFSATLDYNHTIRDCGAEDMIDVWAIHYYGKQFSRVTRSGGVAQFLNSLRTPIWMTESGETGPTNQLAYVEQVWPFLREEIPALDRIYYYQFGETVPSADNFGLRTTDPGFPVSDLYVHLRDG